MRILHVLDHSVPLHSGYSFRTLSLLREQRKLGWETFHLTGPKQGGSALEEEDVEGWHFFRTPPTDHAARLPGLSTPANISVKVRFEAGDDEYPCDFLFYDYSIEPRPH